MPEVVCFAGGPAVMITGMGESWTTLAQIEDKRTELEQSLGASWHRPAAWAIVHEAGGEIVVDRVNVGEGMLPALVLATVAAWPDRTGSVPLSAAGLDAAIAMLAPAEACVEVEHPNLRAWRYLHQEIGDGGSAVIVALEAIDLPGHDDRFVAAVLAAIHHGRVENPDGTTTLWRPVGPAELALLEESGFTAWPPRLPDQPIFYPVLNEQYAAQIARDWNVAASGSGFVTRFTVATAFARRYPTRQAGGSGHLELWIPAEDLEAFNAHLTGLIEVVGEHR